MYILCKQRVIIFVTALLQLFCNGNWYNKISVIRRKSIQLLFVVLQIVCDDDPFSIENNFIMKSCIIIKHIFKYNRPTSRRVAQYSRLNKDNFFSPFGNILGFPTL